MAPTCYGLKIGESVETQAVGTNLTPYTSSGTYVVSTEADYDIIIVGGGGGGAVFNTKTNWSAGGGGASSCVRCKYHLKPGTYTITVGALKNASSISDPSGRNLVVCLPGDNGSASLNTASGGSGGALFLPVDTSYATVISYNFTYGGDGGYNVALPWCSGGSSVYEGYGAGQKVSNNAAMASAAGYNYYGVVSGGKGGYIAIGTVDYINVDTVNINLLYDTENETYHTVRI